MDSDKNDKSALSQVARNTVSITKLSPSRLPLALPRVKWMLPTISRYMSRSLSRHPHIATQLPFDSESLSTSRHSSHHQHYYHCHSIASPFMGRDAFCPHSNPVLLLGSGYSLSAKETRNNTDSNDIDSVNVRRMISRTVTSTTSDRLSPILPLPDVASKVRQIGIGVEVVAANNMGALNIAAADATTSQRQLKKNAQLHYCHLCHKDFKRKSWLQRHLLSHSSQRHYRCPWCLSKHKRKDNLLQHMKLKHARLVVKEMQSQNHYIEDGARNNNVRGLLDEGKLNKDDVKEVLHALINKYNE